MWRLRQAQFNNSAYAPASVSYTGPGNVLSTAYAWYSPARAYTAAFATGGTAIMRLVDQAGANAIDINILSTGFADVTAINNWVSANGVTTIKVTTLYDQSGNGRDVVQGTLVNMPGLALNSTPTGTLPAIDFNVGTNPVLATAATYTQAQPLTGSVVINRNGTVGLGGVLGTNSAGGYLVQGTASANQVAIAMPTQLTATASDNAWHAINTLGNGASSAINVDGSETTGNAGTSGFSAANIRLGRSGANPFFGLIAEAGFWAATSDSTIRGNLNSNQHGLSGYNF